jgi:hypothetical protein
MYESGNFESWRGHTVSDQAIDSLYALYDALDRVESRADLRKILELWSPQDESSRRLGQDFIYDAYRALRDHEGDW